MKIFSRDHVIYNFEYGVKERYRVKSGDTFVVETNDCFHQQITNEEQLLMEIDMDIVNPATGPIYIENAEPGDILKVDILDITLPDHSVAAAVPGEGGLPEESTTPIVQIIEIKEGKAHYLGKEIPVHPMIGVIGVAPAKEDGVWGTHTPWKHGGNMDSKVIGTGSTLYFNVNQSGGMLALGDCHAAMGDGELCFTGLEIASNVRLRVSVLKEKRLLDWPILETEETINIIGSGETLEVAMKAASSDAVAYISDTLNVSWPQAYVMASQAMDLRISQVVNPRKTIRAEIPKYILTMDELLEKR
ncbi:acetamidase/formamidase family protein [Vagococcus elongatus]|uniref:Formamidase n=1 Tax=Vagococcus elongatus TaxID=180344 RepID=A0A430APZ4_9ENTE|nr:acetamidase/formamidase family protein [Vagococcus elongatus]RSU10136.1 formamidase [Vagococcus elongatus]